MSICERCVQGNVVPGEPKGSIQPNGAYFIAGPTEQTGPKKAIFLLTDIFGLPLKNCKITADHLAEQVGCDVWVPDLFSGNPPIKLNEMNIIPDTPGVGISFTTKVKLLFLALSRIPTILASRPSVTQPRAEKLIADLKAERGYEKVGIVGYCYGGTLAIRIAPKGLAHSAVIAHPGGCTPDEAKAIKIPVSWACAEEDMGFTPKVRQETEAIFAARQGKAEEVEYEFRDYEGTVHGFAARPNLGVPAIKEAFEKALQQTVDWFKKTLCKYQQTSYVGCCLSTY